MSAFHDLNLRALDGQDLPLAPYKGQIVLVVNVASKCGLTPQYAGLEKLHQAYRERGFTVLGLPCNQFAAQEPGSEDEIRVLQPQLRRDLSTGQQARGQRSQSPSAVSPAGRRGRRVPRRHHLELREVPGWP